MKYEKYTVLDFVKDEDFQNWVKFPDKKSDFYWESWMQNHPDKKGLMLGAREILSSINFPAKKASRDLMDDIFVKVLKDERPEFCKKKKILKPKNLFRINKILGIAASVLLITTFGYVFYHLNQKPFESRNVNSIEEIIKVNPSGQKSTIHLVDGSKIKLNASSTLRIADNFGIKNREVYLDGEAFFKIAKNSKKPFIVHTGNVSTLVTGTAFNVNAYQDKKSINVAVFEGNVQTILYNERGSDTLVLQKSDMAVYNKSADELSKTTFNYLETMAWKDGVIYFNDANPGEAFKYLEKWYGVDIQVINQNKIQGAFYGEFKNENLENILTIMGIALEFECQFKDSIIFIKPKKY